MVKEKTYIPDDFKIEESVRLYTEVRWGTRHLADQFLGEFIRHFKELKEKGDAKKGKHINWNRTLQNWVYWSSPGQQFYQVAAWEHRLHEAKQMDYAIKPRFHVPDLKFKPAVKPPKFDEIREKLRRQVQTEQVAKQKQREFECMPEELERQQREEFLNKRGGGHDANPLNS